MTVHEDYASKTVGLARVMDEGPYSDGSTALEIRNFRRTERGLLDTTFRLLPLRHPAALGGLENVDGVPDCFSAASGCRAMGFVAMHGDVPEILFLCHDGVFRYAPWQTPTGANNGFEEQFYFDAESDDYTVAPNGRSHFPPQIESVGNRLYFTFCDGGGAYVWDGSRIRPFGFTQRPHSPSAMGPAKEQASDNPNEGGFSVKGRVGTAETDWTIDGGQTVGGVDNFERHYYAAFEGPDGNYSAMSARGGVVTMRLALAEVPAADANTPYDLLRRFRVMDIPQGPPHTAAVILLCTPNLRRLAPGDDGSPRLLQRLPNGGIDQWIDDIPDGELGPVWEDRAVTPIGFYLLKNFAGSLFIGRTDAYPSRIWWSEQTSAGATPESILATAWRDVYPSTGALTGWHEVSGNGQPMLLVFKEAACHFLAGVYPEWQVGTLHREAGLAGPNLIKSLPDGSVLWYGNRTFWLMGPDGSIKDVGVSIRKRLRRVNGTEAKKGVAFLDRRSQEALFFLPVDDSLENNMGFVWDWEAQGWRLIDHMSVKAALELPEDDLVLVSGTYEDEQNVFVWGRGVYGLENANGDTYSGANDAVYQSGWMTLSRGAAHGFWRVNQLIVTALESQEGHAQVRAYQNWDSTTPAADPDTSSLKLAHPEDNDVAFWQNTAGDTDDPAVIGTDTYRTARFYTVAVGIEIPSAEVLSVKISVDAGDVFALVSADVYGPQVAGPGGRTPRTREGTDG